MIKVVVGAIVASIGVILGLLLRKKDKNHTSNQEDRIDSTLDSGFALDKVYEALLDEDTETPIPPSTGKPQKVVVKLKDRSFWSVNGSIITSSLVLFAILSAIVTVSISSQNAYSERKANDERQTKNEEIESIKEQQDKEEHQMQELYHRLDSIDAHIRPLRPVPKTGVKKKGQ